MSEFDDTLSAALCRSRATSAGRRIRAERGDSSESCPPQARNRAHGPHRGGWGNCRRGDTLCRGGDARGSESSRRVAAGACKCAALPRHLALLGGGRRMEPAPRETHVLSAQNGYPMPENTAAPSRASLTAAVRRSSATAARYRPRTDCPWSKCETVSRQSPLSCIDHKAVGLQRIVQRCVGDARGQTVGAQHHRGLLGRHHRVDAECARPARTCSASAA